MMPYDRDDNFPDERLTSQCDCCGEYKPDCEDVTYQGMDTHACAKCRACEDDEAADYADWRYHQEHDQ
jgi:hypothetical protein